MEKTKQPTTTTAKNKKEPEREREKEKEREIRREPLLATLFLEELSKIKEEMGEISY